MCSAIDNPTSFKIHAKTMSAVELSNELYAVYGQNALSVGIVTAVECSKSGKQMFTMKSAIVVVILFKMLTKKYVKDGT
jgi:hypothetical protein